MRERGVMEEGRLESFSDSFLPSGGLGYRLARGRAHSSTSGRINLQYGDPIKRIILFFVRSILRCGVAVFTMRRQSSRIAAFLQADARPMFCWPRSASTARSQVWLGRPNGRFQSGGSFRITAAIARW